MLKDGRFKHLSKIHQVPTFLSSASENKLSMLTSTGFGAFADMCTWTGFPESFVKWVCRNFEAEHCQIRLNNMLVLPIKAEDFERVYNLRNEGKRVDLSKCSRSSVKELRKEFGWDLDAKDLFRVQICDLEKVLKGTKRDRTWCKAMVLYIISCLLCPDSLHTLSLRYAYILEDLKNVRKYNWCEFALNHLKHGITAERQSPKADMA